MQIKFSRFRTFMLTFGIGLMAAGSGMRYVEDVPVRLPAVESGSPIIIRLCPDEAAGQGHWENGTLYFSSTMEMNCNMGGGGHSGVKRLNMHFPK